MSLAPGSRLGDHEPAWDALSVRDAAAPEDLLRRCYPDGMIKDKGCGKQKADGTFGDPVTSDVWIR